MKQVSLWGSHKAFENGDIADSLSLLEGCFDRLVNSDDWLLKVTERPALCETIFYERILITTNKMTMFDNGNVSVSYIVILILNTLYFYTNP